MAANNSHEIANAALARYVLIFSKALSMLEKAHAKVNWTHGWAFGEGQRYIEELMRLRDDAVALQLKVQAIDESLEVHVEQRSKGRAERTKDPEIS